LIKAKLPNAFVFGAETVFVFEGTLDWERCKVRERER
jgi:Zn-dependent protease with chaperone function